LAQVSVPLRDLVFENELPTESVPCQIGYYSVVLVPVLASVSENDVWWEFASNPFERILDFSEMRREIAVPKLMEVDHSLRRGA
jgi:hypothetical protein